MILDNKQAAKYSRILNAKYKKDSDKTPAKDYSKLFQQQGFLTSAADKKIVKKTFAGTTKQFQKDVQASAHVESEFCMLYQCHNYFPNAEYELNDCNRFDMKVTYSSTKENDDTKYYAYAEIKNDMTAKNTKNIAIEYTSWGKPSGIAVTEAYQWVHRIEGFYLVFKTQDLIGYINEKKPRSVKGGDSYASDNYLISVTDALEVVQFVIVDDFSLIYQTNN